MAASTDQLGTGASLHPVTAQIGALQCQVSVACLWRPSVSGRAQTAALISPDTPHISVATRAYCGRCFQSLCSIGEMFKYVKRFWIEALTVRDMGVGLLWEVGGLEY